MPHCPCPPPGFILGGSRSWWPLLVCGVFQTPRWSETNLPPWSDVHSFPGFWIPSCASRAVLDRECAQTMKADTVAISEQRDDSIENHIDHSRRFRFGCPGIDGYGINDIGLAFLRHDEDPFSDIAGSKDMMKRHCIC